MMARKAFDMMMEGMEDAIAYAGGDATRGRKATVDVRWIRSTTRLTQTAFARRFGFPVATLRDWEQGRRRPDSGSVTLLRMIAVDPGGVERIIGQVR